MTYSSCIRHPHFELQITIREWQVKACKTKAAPYLLNLFEKTFNRHLENWKIAKLNGAKPEELSKMLWQRWTEDQLEMMLLNQCKRDSIREGRKELEKLNFIKIGVNPFGNKQDRGIWIMFNWRVVNDYVEKYVKEKYPSNPELYLNGSKGKSASGKSSKPKESKPDKFEADIKEIFSEWQRIFEKPNTKLTDSKKRKIRARLKENYSKQFIIEACEGCKLSDWHVENIEFDIAKICRDSTNLEKHQTRFIRSGKQISSGNSQVKEIDKTEYQQCADYLIDIVFRQGKPLKDVNYKNPVITNGDYLAEICISKMNQHTILDENQKSKVKKICNDFVNS